MKRSCYITIILAIAVFATLSTIQMVDAAEFLGDYCWSVDQVEFMDGTLKLGITSLGGNHYLATGKFIRNDGKEACVNGNAEIHGSHYRLSLFGTFKDESYFTSSSSLLELDISTLNGTGNKLIQIHDLGTGVIDIQSTTSTLTFTTCP